MKSEIAERLGHIRIAFTEIEYELTGMAESHDKDSVRYLGGMFMSIESLIANALEEFGENNEKE